VNHTVVERACDIDSVQVDAMPTSAHELDHESIAQPSAGVAVSVTVEPFVIGATLLEHPAPQVSEPSLELTVPEPCLLTVRSNAARANKAVVERDCDIVTVQVDEPADWHELVQPMKFQPVAGTAVRLTVDPDRNEPVQVDAHSIPSGADNTVPAPGDETATVKDLAVGAGGTGAASDGGGGATVVVGAGTVVVGGAVVGGTVVGGAVVVVGAVWGTSAETLGAALVTGTSTTGGTSTATIGTVVTGGTGPIEATSDSCTAVGTVVTTTTGDSLSGGATASAGNSTTTAVPTATLPESACGEATTVPTPVAMTPLNTLRLTARPTLDDSVAPAPTATEPIVVVVADTTDAAVPVTVAAVDAPELAAP
jgi:hypothetical protein